VLHVTGVQTWALPIYPAAPEDARVSEDDRRLARRDRRVGLVQRELERLARGGDARRDRGGPVAELDADPLALLGRIGQPVQLREIGRASCRGRVERRR